MLRFSLMREDEGNLFATKQKFDLHDLVDETKSLFFFLKTCS